MRTLVISEFAEEWQAILQRSQSYPPGSASSAGAHGTLCGLEVRVPCRYKSNHISHLSSLISHLTSPLTSKSVHFQGKRLASEGGGQRHDDAPVRCDAMLQALACAEQADAFLRNVHCPRELESVVFR